MKGKKYEGFSLIEILVVVALIIILATITIVAINPAKNFRDTRNAQRSADIMQILNAVTQYTSEEGNVLSDLGTIANCDAVAPDPTSTPVGDVLNLETILVDDYIVEIPVDPRADDGFVYSICQTDNGRVEVSADKEIDANTTAPITVKR
jgi:type IV pilus assembly protein PilA